MESGGGEEEKKSADDSVVEVVLQKRETPKARRGRGLGQKKRFVNPKSLQFVFSGEVIEQGKPVEIGVGIAKPKKQKRETEHEKMLTLAHPLAIALGVNEGNSELSKLISLVSAYQQGKLPPNVSQLIGEILTNPEKSQELLENLQKLKEQGTQPAAPKAQPKPVSKPVRKAQMTTVPSVRVQSEEKVDAPASQSEGDAAPQKIRVKFVDPRKIINRRYASWDEITDYGGWACEAQERPKYILDPIGTLLNACTDIVQSQPDEDPTKVLETIGDNFEDFLMMGIPCDTIEPEPIPRAHLQTDCFHRTPMAEIDSGRKDTLHAEVRKTIELRDREMDNIICEFHAGLQKQLHAHSVTKRIPEMSKLASISHTLWGRDFKVNIPDDGVTRGRRKGRKGRWGLVRQTTATMDFFNSAQDDIAGYMAETLNMTGIRDMKRKFDTMQLREDIATYREEGNLV